MRKKKETKTEKTQAERLAPGAAADDFHFSTRKYHLELKICLLILIQFDFLDKVYTFIVFAI